MASTRVDIVIPFGVWTNIYTSSGITVGTQVTIYNKGSNPCLVATGSIAPTSVNGFHLYPFPNSNPLEIAPGESGLWAFSPNGTTTLLVQEQSLQKYSNGSSLITHIHPKGMDFDTAVGLGLVPGVRRVTALGNNPDVDQGTLPEDVWSVGGTYLWMTAATSLEVVSSSTSDTSAGVGARTVTIFGLDANYVEVNQTITKK